MSIKAKSDESDPKKLKSGNASGPSDGDDIMNSSTNPVPPGSGLQSPEIKTVENMEDDKALAESESNESKWQKLKGLEPLPKERKDVHPIMSWLQDHCNGFNNSDVKDWLISQRISGEDLCAKVEAGEKPFIEWADTVKLVGGPATKLYKALAPFAVKGRIGAERLPLSTPIRVEGVKHEEGKQGHEGVDFRKGKRILQRDQIVGSILEVLGRQGQVQVRAPPYSGKTSFVQLITRRLFNDPKKRHVNIISLSFLRVKSLNETFQRVCGLTFTEILDRIESGSEVWYLILDEVQRIYDVIGTGSQHFWDWLKEGIGGRVYVLAFSAYGGTMFDTPHRFAEETVIYQYPRLVPVEVEDENGDVELINTSLPGIAPTVEEIQQLCSLYKFVCDDGYRCLGEVTQDLVLSMLKSSLPLCQRAIRWLWRMKQERITNQDALDAWACECLVSEAFITHMSGLSDRGVPRMADVPVEEREALQKICDRAVNHQTIEKSESTRKLVSRGILAEVSDEQYFFASPIVASVYVRQRYHCAAEGKLPAELDRSSPSISDLVRLLVNGMDPKQLQFGLSNGSGGKPLEALYENEFYRACLKLIPQQYGVCCQIGKTLGVKGMVDIFVNGRFGFALELLRDTNDLKEHRERFLPEGKYHKLVRNGTIKQYAVIQFRSYKDLNGVEVNRFSRFENVYRVCFNLDDFSRMLLVYPDLSSTEVILVGRQ